MTAWLPRALVFLAGAFLLALLTASTRVQLRLALEATGDARPAAQLWVGDQPWPLSEAPGLSPNQLEIVHLASGEGASKATLASTTTENRGQIDAFEVVSGDWKRDPAGEWTSEQPGSALRWAGVTSGLTIWLRQSPAGSIRVRWNEQEQIVGLPREGAGSFDLHSRTAVFSALVPLWRSRIHASWPPSTARGEASLVFGNLVLASRTVDPTDARLELWLDGAQKLRVLGELATNALVLLLRSLVLAFVFFLAGLVLLAPLLSHLTPLERLWLPVLVGFSFWVVATTSLAYALPVKTAMPIVALALVVAALTWHRRRGREVFALLYRELPSTLRSAALPAAVSMLAGVIYFMPALVEGEWFLGHHYTDTWHYTNWSQAFLDQRMLDAVRWETMLRYCDVVSLSVSSVLLRDDTRSIYAAFGFFLSLWTPFAALSLFERVGLATDAARLGAALCGFSSSVYCLFVQNYHAHFIFVLALWCAVFLTVLCLEHSRALPADARWSLWIATGIVYAFNVSNYPFQFVVPFAWAAVTPFVRDSVERRWRIRELVFVGAITLLFVNVNAQVLIDYPAVTHNYGDWTLVNGIARNFVFPFYKSPLLVVIAFGLRDFVLNSTHLSEIFQELYGGSAPQAISAGASAYFKAGWLWGAPALVLTVIGLVRCFVSGRRSLVFIGVCVGVFLAFMAVLAAQGQVYGFGKVVMTLSVIALIPLSLGLAWVGERAIRAPARAAIGAFCVGFVLLNLASGSLENADLLVNRKSRLLHVLRTHVSELDLDLKQLAELLEGEHERAGPLHVRRGCTFADEKSNDGARVIDARIDHLDFLHAQNVASAPVYEVVFNQPGCSERPDGRVLFTSSRFRLYAPVR